MSLSKTSDAYLSLLKSMNRDIEEAIFRYHYEKGLAQNAVPESPTKRDLFFREKLSTDRDSVVTNVTNTMDLLIRLDFIQEKSKQ